MNTDLLEKRDLGSPTDGSFFRDLSDAMESVAGLGSQLGRLQHLRRDRLKAAVVYLRERLKAIAPTFDARMLDEADLHLFEMAAQQIAREHRDEHRKRLIAVLTDGWVHKERAFDERLRFLRAAEEFGEVYIAILRVLAEQKRGNAEKPDVSYEDLATRLFGEKYKVPAAEQLLPALDDLAGEYAFISRGWGKGEGLHFLTSRTFGVEGLARSSDYRIEPQGERFLAALPALDDSPGTKPVAANP